MSAALIDPRPAPPVRVTKPRTSPLRPCEICGTTFVVKKGNPSRFCSPPCWWRRLGHDTDFVKTARRHWKQGFTASQIAARLTAAFGRDFTKNAVIGLAHRHGFAPRPSPIRRKAVT